MGEYHGLPTKRLASNSLELECLETAGPRIVRLSYEGSNNLLAEIPQITIPTPYGDYHYMGGHRLWYSPEAMPRSYIPDNDGLTSSDLPDGLMLDGRTETATGIRKCIEVHLNPNRPEVTLKHTLTNEGIWDVELAPWVITMFRLGGVAILPTQVERPDMDQLLPNRHLSFWVYSNINDPRLHLENDFLLVRANPEKPLFKIGTFNPLGWMTYWLDGILIRKTFVVQPGLPHPDYGCNAEIYCDGDFIELESLAPLAKLAPGHSVSFTETWELYDSLEQEFLPEKIIELCKQGAK